MPLSLAAAALAAGASARAELSLAPLFADHAVLQSGKRLPVWGRAAAGESITVTFRGQSVHTVAGSDGRWTVVLEPLEASAEPADLVVAGSETKTIRDVLVGEVWLASGQSNMEWPVAMAKGAAEEMAEANFPLMRQIRIERTVATAPADTVPTTGWQPVTPQSVGGFSAIAYFFGRDLQRKLGVPVGIIDSYWGGTQIESWLSDATRDASSVGPALAARWAQAKSEWPPERVARYPADMAAWQKAQAEADAKHAKNPLPWPPPPASDDSPARPGGLFNAMIAPLQPYALRGILWYQGESNVGREREYAELFPAMITAWRANWGEPELPFYFVQLPNYADGEPRGRKWARLREAQAAALKLPATAMAVAIDAGEPDNLHPTEKREVARRLALVAKARIYELQVDWSGPVFASATREGPALRVRFEHAATGLIAHDRPVQALEIAGADKVFHAATAKIAGDTLLVSSPAVKEPVAVRYAWSNAPAANLYNGSGLPAAPFRSDDW